MDEKYNIEGCDIRGEDMVSLDDGPSEIVEFFNNKTILLTGATGYLGRMFVEKLLRTCQSLRKIYVLVRPKKGKQIEERFEELFQGPNMEPMKRENPNFLKSVHLIAGDLLLPDLGMDNETIQTMINEVNIIIQCAATVRFDQMIRKAAYINVRSVKDLIAIAKKMHQLESFLYISTAFSNCPSLFIDETIYTPPLTGDQLLQMVECMSDTLLEKITPDLLGKWPNTYAYTKIIAEKIIETEGKGLPIAITRPSMVIASVNEPLAGWIDNFYGPTGGLIAGFLGIMRSAHNIPENKCDVIPADYVINSSLAILWKTAKAWHGEGNLRRIYDGITTVDEELKIYNIVSSPEAPLIWGDYFNLVKKYALPLATIHIVWYPLFLARANKYHHLIMVFLLQTVPAYFIDFIARVLGKKTQMVEMYRKLDKFSSVVSYFSLREWTFKNDNTKDLWNQLSPVDKKLFEFSMEKFDWECYFEVYVKGARMYTLKDPLDTLENARAKYRKLRIAHYILSIVLILLFYKLLSFLYNNIF